MADPGPLIEPHIPALRRYAFALLRDRDRADDLVQDTLERALSRWLLRRADGDVRAWLFTILRNQHVSSWRRDRRHGAAVAIDETTMPAVAARQDTALEVHDVLAALTSCRKNRSRCCCWSASRTFPMTMPRASSACRSAP